MKLKIFLVLFAQLLHISPTISVRKVTEIIPESPFIAKEGERKQLHCILEASEGPPPASYGNVFAYPNPPPFELLKTGKNITVSKETKGLQAITTVKFDPLSINDVGSSGFYCTSQSYPSGTHVDSFILPKGGVPKINFTSTIPNVGGAEAVFNCEAEIEAAGVQIYLTWLHYKEGNSSVVSAKEKPKRGGKSPKKTIKSVLKVVLAENTAGVYECVISARLKNSVDFNYTRNATLTYSDRVKIVDGAQAKQRLQVYEKKEAVMICQAVSVPPATVTWKKGNSPIDASSDSRYRFSSYKSTEFGTFVLKNVDYKDRAVYTCNASNSISFVTMEFTLRVRDPLGALWPFLGIVIEAIVLAVIIVGYEYYKKKNKEKDREAKEKETSPLLPSTSQPGVAYTAGEGGAEASVKMRPSAVST